MSKNKILGFAVGPILNAALSLVTLPLMAWAFSPEDLGRINLLQVIISFSLLLTVLGLDQAYVREYHSSKDKRTLLNACFTPGFSLLLIIILSTLAFSQELSFWLFEEKNPRFYILTIICILSNYILRFLSLILRMQGNGIAFSISQFSPKALQIIILGPIIYFDFERNFLTLLWISMLSILVATLVCISNTRSEWNPALRARPNASLIRSLLKFGTPLVFSGLAYWGLTATSALILRSHASFNELGIYSVTSSFSGAAAIFQSIFSVIWAPTIYKWVSEGVSMERVDDITRQALAIICLIFTLAGCFSWLTDYLLPPHYINVKYLLVCAIAPPLLYTLSEITCVGITITRRTTLTIWITISALATNICLSLILIPLHGATGAMIANAIAYLVFFVGRSETSAKVWRQFPRIRLYIHVLAFVILSILTAYLGPILPFHYTSIWMLLLPILFVSFNKEFGEILKKYKL